MGNIKGSIGRDGFWGENINIKSLSFGGQETKNSNIKSREQAPINDGDRFKAFISFAGEDEQLATFIKDFVEISFGDLSPCFVSNDPACIAAGNDWFKQISDALHTVRVVFVLASEISLSRQWVNFEIGVAWSRDIPIIFLCYGGLTPTTLPLPYVGRQALFLSKDNPEDTLLKLVKHVEQSLDIRATPKFSMNHLAQLLKIQMAKNSQSNRR